MKNIHSQPTYCVSIPPNVGPMALATPFIAPQTPMASPRCCGGTATTRMARLTGTMIAPPTACSARKAISRSMWPAIPQASEKTVKITMPAMNSFFRPSRSATRPAGMSSTANTRL